MYQVMVVDDELIIREGIRTFINWEKLGCQILHIAADGLEAMSFLETAPVRPDIVITDIRMPGKNGLELASYLRIHFPSVRLIILSGYSDFKYAQEALRQGAFDYILKDNPLTKIENSVLRAIDEIKREHKQQQDLDDIRDTVSQSQEELQIKFYQDLIYDIPLSAEAIAQKIRWYQIPQGGFYCILIKVCMTDGSQPKEDFIRTSSQFLKRVFSAAKPVVFPVQSGNLCIILHEIGSLDKTPLIPSLNQFFSFTGNTSYALKAAVSSPHASVTELNTAYLECCYCFKHHAKSQKKILYYSEENIPLDVQSAGSQNLPLKKALQYMEDNYGEQISLPDIARAAGLNASYLSRLFKKETGESITGHLTRLRIERAKELLKDDSLRLRDIAEAVGFNDVSYFSNTFKKTAGISPTEFRTISEML